MITQSEPKHRIEYIDCMRGIGMLLVVLGHAINSGQIPLCKIIWSFHMPLFFFINGMLNNNRKEKPFFQFLLSRIRTLLVPQILLAVLTICSNILISCVAVKSLTLREIDFVSPFLDWFLPTLFVVEMINWVLRRYILKKTYFHFVTIAIEAILFYVCNYTAISFVQQILAGLFFSEAGLICRPLLDRISNENNDSIVSFTKRWGGGFAFLVATIILSYFNEPVLMYINQYGNKIAFIIVAFSGVITIFYAALRLTNSSFVRFIGENSIIVYVLHFVYYRIIKGITERFLGIHVFANYPVYWILFAVNMILLLPSIYVCSRYIPFIFGKTKKKVA